MRADSPWRRSDARAGRSLRTRERIYRAALAEFQKAGYADASIARIARRAGVSRPSFYFHFPSKEHVLLELLWELEHEVVASLGSVDDPVAALHTFVDELVRIEERVGRGSLFRDLLQVWTRPSEGLATAEHVQPILDAIRDRFVAAHRCGALRAGVGPDQATLLFLTGVFGYLIGVGGSAEGERENLHALADLYVGDATGARGR